MHTVTLSIGGMTCGHCVARVRTALETVPGAAVRGVRVGSAEVAVGPATAPDVLIAAVQDAGYEAAVASGTADEADEIPSAGCACGAPAPAALARAGRASSTTCH